MVLPRKMDSRGTPIWRMVVLRGPQNPFKGGFQMDQENRPQLRLGPFVIRFPTLRTYRAKNRKSQKKNAIREGGMSRLFLPLKRRLPFAKGLKKALPGGKMPDLGAKKGETSHLRE